MGRPLIRQVRFLGKLVSKELGKWFQAARPISSLFSVTIIIFGIRVIIEKSALLGKGMLRGR